MCPDRQLISLYVDGELPSPWREKLESHLSLCTSCARQAEGYRALSASLAEAPEANVEEARARVWAAVARRTNAEAAPVRRPRRALVLPLPAAIAAVLAVAIVAAGGTGVALGSRPDGAEAVAVVEQAQVPPVPVSDMGSVLRYLETQDGAGEILIIRLPESSNFSYEGRPTLIRAADYNGRPLP